MAGVDVFEWEPPCQCGEGIQRSNAASVIVWSSGVPLLELNERVRVNCSHINLRVSLPLDL